MLAIFSILLLWEGTLCQNLNSDSADFECRILRIPMMILIAKLDFKYAGRRIPSAVVELREMMLAWPGLGSIRWML